MKKIVINNSLCKYPILHKIAGESGAFETLIGQASLPLQLQASNSKQQLIPIQQQQQQQQDWDIFWIDTGVSMERVLELNEFQKINHFPGMHEICRKDQLARKSIQLSKTHPKDYNFLPKSWIFPADWAHFKQFCSTKRNASFISKPDHGCQGKGIFLFDDPYVLEKMDRDGMVVQSYIRNPCLLDGFKFDLRVYVLVTSVSPLRIFVSKDGLARFATEKYEKPATRNLDNMRMHLTNYAINKNSPDYIVSEDDVGNTGSKRSIQSIFEELELLGKRSSKDLWAEVHDVIVKTLLLVQPGLSKNCKPWFPKQDSTLPLKGSQCFEILGFDILLDSKFKVWVLEVNHSPSFTCDTPLDEKIKSKVILEAIKLLHVSKKSVKKHRHDQRAKSMQRLLQISADLPAITTLPKVNDSVSVIMNSKSLSQNGKMDSQTTLLNLDVGSTLPTSSGGKGQETTALPAEHMQALARYYKLYPKATLEKLSKWEDSHTDSYTRVFPPSQEAALAKYIYLLHQTEKGVAETTATRLRATFLLEKEAKALKEKERIKRRVKLNSTIPSKILTASVSTTLEMRQIKQVLHPIKLQSLRLKIFNFDY